MIKATDLSASFEEIIGWPYKSPGTNNQNGIDCSGAFVRAFSKYGQSIYHGSNTIFRKYCGATGQIDGDASRLYVGMAVFKQRFDGKEPEKYRNDGIGNMYHIGLVTKTNPLRIVHATEPKAKVDTSIGKGESAWDYYGWLDSVNYSENAIDIITEQESNEVNDIEIIMTDDSISSNTAKAGFKSYFAVVNTANGKPVNMRAEPSLDCNLYKQVPNGETILVIAQTESEGRLWSRVERRSRRWYIASEYLVRV